MNHLIPILAGAALLAGPRLAAAADHVEAPGAIADPAADITDFYAWHTDDGKIVAVLDFSPLVSAGGTATYDADILYGIHLDVDADGVSDGDILIRFGQNTAGDWGVQVEDLPGATGTVSGAIETTIDAGNGLSVYAGTRDDPFFFDLQGYLDTLSTATVAFTTADFFAGYNVGSIVVEMDTAAAVGSSHTVQIWATTGRK